LKIINNESNYHENPLEMQPISIDFIHQIDSIFQLFIANVRLCNTDQLLDLISRSRSRLRVLHLNNLVLTNLDEIIEKLSQQASNNAHLEFVLSHTSISMLSYAGTIPPNLTLSNF